jgi:predicted nucleic acid-binding Zn ribbon protein
MTYTYKYKDGDHEEFDIIHPMKDDALTEHEGRPCSRVMTGGLRTTFLGTGWPGIEADKRYTTLGPDKSGKIVIKD